MSHFPIPPRRWLTPSLILLTVLALANPQRISAASGKITAQWDFDQGDLRASIGKDMQYGDGPTGRVKDHTSFGTTTSFGIPDIDGKPAHVMKYTRDEFTPDATDKNPRATSSSMGLPPTAAGPKSISSR